MLLLVMFVPKGKQYSSVKLIYLITLIKILLHTATTGVLKIFLKPLLYVQ